MISASIVTHLTDNMVLNNALRSVANSCIEKLYIVDNSPCEVDIPKFPAICSCGLEFIKVDNHGFGHAHNVAIKKAIAEGAEFHLVLNPDVEWEGDAIAPLVEFMRQHPETGITAPRVEYPDGTLQYTARMLPTPLDLILKRFLPPAISKKRMRRYLLADADHHKQFNSPYLQGSILLFKTEALKQTGGFDERFFMYPEDIDITRRIHRNWKTLYLPLTTVTHRHAAASRHNFKMLRIHIINMAKYFCKYGWLIDSERKKINKRLLRNLPVAKNPEPGRG